MKERLQKRLQELKTEFESGQKALADLENRSAGLRNSLLRISGAIQVLEEELTKEGTQEFDDVGQSRGSPESEKMSE